jgi:hypothetical protein
MPQAGAVLDQAELIALPVSWQIVHREDEKHGLHAEDQRASENDGRTSTAAGTDCSSGFELETRSSATNHDDSGGGWSVSVGALRQESLVRTAGVPGRVRFAKSRQLRGAWRRTR